MSLLIDAHCHLTGEEYGAVGGVELVLKRAKEAGVERVIVSGYDMDSSLSAKELSEHHEAVYFTAGFHPSELNKYKEGDLNVFERLFAHEKCVAAGEIGLDYHFPDNPERAFQKELFAAQLVLADRAGLPIVVHSRDAAQDTLDLLREHKSYLKKGGLMHCYSYSPEMVAPFAELGLYFSFGGTSTFKNAKKVHESAKIVPSDRILTETDAPYLAPEPFRGTFPNECKNIRRIAENLSALRGEKEEELEEKIASNAKRLFFKLG